MKLFYYQRPDGQTNFGDDLNRWLWPKLNPYFLDNDPNTLFIGTGTLLNDQLASRTAPTRDLVIFGTGAGYEKPVQPIPLSWDIRCVRGPLTARRLRLSPAKAITDGGLLTARVYKPPTERSGISFMPHIHHANEADTTWQHICDMAGIRYIDPRWPVEKVLSAIASTERLLAEAMHGAIIADALRVPWIPITTGPRIYSFKWQDWCASMELFYHPYHLPTLNKYKRYGRGLRSGRQALCHWFNATLEGPASTPQYQLLGDEKAIAHRLANIAKQAPTLSQTSVHRTRLDQLSESFEQTCQKYQQAVALG